MPVVLGSRHCKWEERSALRPFAHIERRVGHGVGNVISIFGPSSVNASLCNKTEPLRCAERESTDAALPNLAELHIARSKAVPRLGIRNCVSGRDTPEPKSFGKTPAGRDPRELVRTDGESLKWRPPAHDNRLTI
jgi:hypothetical protein